MFCSISAILTPVQTSTGLVNIFEGLLLELIKQIKQIKKLFHFTFYDMSHKIFLIYKQD